jgi:pyruvate dehydrogenase E2 component (dihydrolipoamide acetyltransferase)
VPYQQAAPAAPGAPVEPAAPPAPAPAYPAAAEPAAPAEPEDQPATAEGPYITPLVRKLAAEHGVNLATVAGTGVGGRIRKQDVLEAARVLREQQPAAAPAPAIDGQQAPPAAAPAPLAPARAIEPSTLRGTTERLSRARQLIARRMVESLQTSAQLTTVVEADVTAISRLRERAKADFETREGVKLSYLPFFALATLEALKVHPKLNAVLNTEAGQIIYHDAEHLGIAVDTERGLMVPVIRNAGDLNIGGLARKIADLAGRTRAGQVSPDELAGGTFTLTNTGSRGALFDTPIINQPQVAILGTGTVVKRPVVMEDPALGEVITVRSMVYLALTYDHRLIDGADATRFLTTVKDRLEEGAFEAELGL